MRRDTIFYQLFQQFPDWFFQLLDEPPPQAKAYRFESISVKETAFQLDGVFLPPESSPPGIVYFCEVQFQKDEQFYERFFSEIFIYLYRYRLTFSNWQAVVIYPRPGTEPSDIAPYHSLLNSGQVHRVYLNQLGDPGQLPLGLAIICLTVLNRAEAPQVAQALVRHTQQKNETNQQAIIDILRMMPILSRGRMTQTDLVHNVKDFVGRVVALLNPLKQ